MAAIDGQYVREGDAQRSKQRAPSTLLRRIRPVGLPALIAPLVLAPVVMLVYGSLRSASPGSPGHFTLDNYRNLLDGRMATAGLNSLIIALFGTALAVAWGAGIAWLVCRTDLKFARFWRMASFVPFYISPLFGALAWNLLASPRIGPLRYLGFPSINSLFGIIWVSGLYFAPYVFLFMTTSLANIDRSYEDAAYMSGATVGRAQRSIVIPLARPALVGSSLIVFVLAIEQFGIPSLLGSPHGITVLSTRIYERINSYPADFPGAAAVGVLLIAIAALGILVRNWFLRRGSYRVIGGKGGSRPTLVSLGRHQLVAQGFCGIYLLAATILPFGALILSSAVQVWGTWIPSGRHWSYIFDKSPQILANSAFSSLGAAVVVTILGFMVGYRLERASRPQVALQAVAMMPLALPGIVIGLGFLWAFLMGPGLLYGTLLGLTVAYAARFLPLAVESSQGAMAQMQPDLEEAAWISGAPRLRSVRLITIPLAWPAIAAGIVLVFISAFREIGASVMLYSTSSVVMSVALWAEFNKGQNGRAAAIALVQSAVIFGAVIVMQRLQRRSARPPMSTRLS